MTLPAGRVRRSSSPDDVRGGTFTLTNHGIAGSLFAMPIINQPQCGILGTGALQKRVVVVTDADGNDSIAIRPMVISPWSSIIASSTAAPGYVPVQGQIDFSTGIAARSPCRL